MADRPKAAGGRSVALLRAVNVGGRAQVSMSDLRKLVTDLGFLEVQSLLQSGNIVFCPGRKSAATLERLFEAEAAARLDLRTDFFVRSCDEWAAVIAANPFRREAERDPSHLVVMFLKHAPTKSAVTAARQAITGPEQAEVEGRHLYIVYPAGIGRSRLTSSLIEAKLDTRGTGRNWNTMLKLADIVGA